MTDYAPIHFIEEPIAPIFEQAPVLEKKPPCPQAFRWHEQTYSVVEMLSEWHDYARRGKAARNMQPQHAATAAQRGSWGVGVFYFRVRVDSGQIFDIYYDRAPKSVDERKGAWFIYRELVLQETQRPAHA
jgi:hypothetical protein